MTYFYTTGTLDHYSAQDPIDLTISFNTLALCFQIDIKLNMAYVLSYVNVEREALRVIEALDRSSAMFKELKSGLVDAPQHEIDILCEDIESESNNVAQQWSLFKQVCIESSQADPTLAYSSIQFSKVDSGRDGESVLRDPKTTILTRM